MVVRKIDKTRLNLTLVMGPSGAGKTSWCKAQQRLYPHIMVVPYDEILYSIRRDYQINDALKRIAVETSINMILELNSYDDQIHVLVDGFDYNIFHVDRLLSMASKSQIVYIYSDISTLTKVHLNNKKNGGPYLKHGATTAIMDQMKFLSSAHLKNICSQYDTGIERINYYNLVNRMSKNTEISML